MIWECEIIRIFISLLLYEVWPLLSVDDTRQSWAPHMAIQSAGQKGTVANICTLCSIFMHLFLFDMRVYFEKANGRTTSTKSAK